MCEYFFLPICNCLLQLMPWEAVRLVDFQLRWNEAWHRVYTLSLRIIWLWFKVPIWSIQHGLDIMALTNKKTDGSNARNEEEFKQNRDEKKQKKKHEGTTNAVIWSVHSIDHELYAYQISLDFVDVSHCMSQLCVLFSFFFRSSPVSIPLDALTSHEIAWNCHVRWFRFLLEYVIRDNDWCGVHFFFHHLSK